MNSALQVLYEREFVQDCTDLDALSDLMDKEKIPSANNEPQKSDWEILMERGAKSEDSAIKTETEASQELAEKRSVREFLSEKDQKLYDATVDKLKKISGSKNLFSGERFFVEDADKKRPFL